MKFLKKTLSVGLSLVLCASMTVPAFAASFADLQDAINGKNGTQFSHIAEDGTESTRYGYAENKDDNGNHVSWGIEAWDDEGGGRKVQLNEDVNHENGDADGGIVISGKNTNVTLNMNGNTIDLNPGSTLDVESETFKDEAGNEVADANEGAVITVKGGASLTVNGAGDDGKKGVITGGNRVKPTQGAGGGIVVSVGAVNLFDVSVEGNKAVDGGGIYVSSASGKASVTTSNVSISGNVATNLGGGIHVGTNDKGTVVLNDTKVTGNKANTGGGISVTKAIVTVNEGSVIANNMSTLHGDDIATNQGTLTLPDVKKMTDENGDSLNLDEDGKPINGWYYDMCSTVDEDHKGWGGNGKNAYFKYENVNGKYKGWAFLKAAHDQYFNLTFMPGYEDESVEDVVVSLERNSDFPEISVPTRDGGYTFSHWALVDADGNAVLDENGEPIVYETLPEKVTEDMILVARWNDPAPAPVDPTDPIDPTDPGIEVEDPDVPLGDEPEVDIDDPAVPLASGPVTRAQFVDYLWRHEGEPAPVQDDGLFEDVTDEHEYSPAMAWAKSIGIIEAYEDGTFEPDELVTVSAVRSILTRFAAYADMTMPALTTLTGAEDEAVLNCDEVLAEFFGEEYAPAKSEDIDIAA